MLCFSAIYAREDWSTSSSKRKGLAADLLVKHTRSSADRQAAEAVCSRNVHSVRNEQNERNEWNACMECPVRCLSTGCSLAFGGALTALPVESVR